MRRICLNTSSLSIVASLLIFFAVGSAQAQSGRRLPKGSTTPTPVPSTQPEKPPAIKTPAQPQISLLVVSDISQNLYLSASFERVQAWVAKRLRDSSALAVMEGERTNRREAIKRAKASTTGFVVFLQMEESGFSSSARRTGRENMDDVSISYAIFSPVTGQSKSSGVVYLNQRSSIIDMGRARTMPCYPNVRGDDYLLLQASLEVAGRIMSAFNVPVPPVCP